MKLSLVERETILLYNQAEPIRVWDYPNKHFHFRARDLKIRKIASGYSLAVLAIETLPSISPSTNTTI